MKRRFDEPNWWCCNSVLIKSSALSALLAAAGCYSGQTETTRVPADEPALAALMADGELAPGMASAPMAPSAPPRFCNGNSGPGPGPVPVPVPGPIPVPAPTASAMVTAVTGAAGASAGPVAVNAGTGVVFAGRSAGAAGIEGAAGAAGSGASPGGIDPACATQPIGFWNFDDCNTSRTDLFDNSFQSHSAFRTVELACTSGQEGQAAAFAARDDLVYAPDQPDFSLDAGVTVAAWVKPDYTDRVRTLFRKRDDANSAVALVINAKKYQFVVRLASGKLASVSAPAIAGQWTHVAATYDGQLLRLYIGGLEVSRTAAAGRIAQGVGPLLIGNDASHRRFQGLIDNAWFNTLAAPDTTIMQLTCIHHEPTLTVSPAVGPAVPPGTPVTYTMTITNPNAENCAPGSFSAFANGPESGFSIDPSFVDLQLASGETTDVPVSVASGTEAEAGNYPISFFAFSSSGFGVPGGGPVSRSVGIAAADSGASGSGGNGAEPRVTNQAQALYVVEEPTGCHVSSNREIMIRDVSVVDDPVRTTPAGPASDPSMGAWTFERLMQQLSPKDADAPDVTEAMFRSFLTPQTVNSFTIEARPPMDPLVLQPWPRTANGKLDLAKAPMRLLAIVNRLDLKDLARGKAGEGRLVFGVLDANGFQMAFTVIFEYLLPAANEAEYRAWVDAFHALQALPFPSESYNAALQAITDRIVARNAVPSMPNGSALIDIRTNEYQLEQNFQWQLREFHISATTGFVEPAAVALTPDSRFNFGDTLARFVNANEASILTETHEVPAMFEGAPFLGGSSLNTIDFWDAPGINNPEARHKFSLNTCNGCHGGETNVFFLQVQPREAGQASVLSSFLTGATVRDPVTGQPRRLAELARRRTLLESIVCPAAQP